MIVVPWNKNIKIISNYLVGPLVFLLLSYFICRQVVRQPHWRSSLEGVWQALQGPAQWRCWLVLALMPLNWGIEARKWQLAMGPLGGLSYRNAYRAILTGTTMASFTPNRMGEYVGRLLYVEEGKRLASISLTIVCSIAQLLVTLLIGLGGLLYLHPLLHRAVTSGQWDPDFWLNVLLGLISALLVSLTIIYFRLSWVLGILGKLPGSKRILPYVKILENFDATTLWKILVLSMLRYGVFILQYGLIFPLFGVSLSVGQVWGGVSVVFLVMAVVPTFTFLTELGLRWEAGIQVLELFSGNTVGILSASFAIWMINLIIPALVGSLLILSIKLVKSK
jgi:hypothetical protein